jgi:Transposase and inactivated derivatives
MDIDVPQDRNSSFEPKIVQKRKKDISDIESKIIAMYSKGLSTTQISEMIDDLYGFVSVHLLDGKSQAYRLAPIYLSGTLSAKVSFRMLPTRCCLKLKNGRNAHLTKCIR